MSDITMLNDLQGEIALPDDMSLVDIVPTVVGTALESAWLEGARVAPGPGGGLRITTDLPDLHLRAVTIEIPAGRDGLTVAWHAAVPLQLPLVEWLALTDASMTMRLAGGRLGGALSGVLHLGGLALPLAVALPPPASGWVLEPTFERLSVADLAAFAGSFGVPDLAARFPPELAASLDAVAVTGLRVHFDPVTRTLRTFALDLEVDADLPLIPGRLELERPRLHLIVRRPGSSDMREVMHRVSAVVRLGALRLPVRVDSSAGAHTVTIEADDVPLPDLATLVDLVGAPVDLPVALPDLRVSDVVLGVDAAHRPHLSASISAAFAGSLPGLPSITMSGFDGSLAVAAGQLTGQLSGGLGLGGASLSLSLVRAQAADPWRFVAASTPGSGPVALSTALAALLDGAGLSPGLPDFGLADLSLTLTPSTGAFAFSAAVTGAWAVPIGVADLTVSGLHVAIARAGTGATATCALTGALTIAGVTMQVGAAVSGGLAITAQAPGLKPWSVIDALCGAVFGEIPIPQQIRDLALSTCTLTLDPHARTMALRGAAAGFGAIELQARRDARGTWGAALALAPSSGADLQALLGVAGLGGLSLGAVVFVLSSIHDPALRFVAPEFAAVTGVTRGFGFSAAVTVAAVGFGQIPGLPTAPLAVRARFGRTLADFSLTAAMAAPGARFVIDPDSGLALVDPELRITPATSDVVVGGRVDIVLDGAPLSFSGGFKLAGGVASLYAAMQGEWREPFGIPGVIARSLAVQLTIGSAPSLAGTVQFGRSQASLAIKPSPTAPVLAFSLASLDLHELLAGVTDVAPASLPASVQRTVADVRFEDIDIYIAPHATTLGDVQCPAGFSVRGRMIAWGLVVDAFVRTRDVGGLRALSAAGAVTLPPLGDHLALRGGLDEHGARRSGPYFKLELAPGQAPDLVIEAELEALGLAVAAAVVRLDDTGFKITFQGLLFGAVGATLEIRGGRLASAAAFDVAATLDTNFLQDLLLAAKERLVRVVGDAQAEIARAQVLVSTLAQKGQEIAAASEALRHDIQAQRDKDAQDLRDREAELHTATTRLDVLDRELTAARATVAAERAAVERKIAAARTDVDGATAAVQGLTSQINATNRWFYGLPKVAAPWVASQLREGAWYAAKIGGLYAARETATEALKVAGRALQAVVATQRAFPIDSDPRVAGILAAWELAKTALATAESAVATLRAGISLVPVDADFRLVAMNTAREALDVQMVAAKAALDLAHGALDGLATLGESLIPSVQITRAGFACGLSVAAGGSVRMHVEVTTPSGPRAFGVTLDLADPLRCAKELVDVLLGTDGDASLAAVTRSNDETAVNVVEVERAAFPSGGTVQLQSWTNQKFIRLNEGALVADATLADPGVEFTLERDGERVGLRSHASGRYVTVRPDLSVSVDSQVFGPSEQFVLEGDYLYHPTRSRYLRLGDSNWVTAELVPGALKYIDCGADGAVWGVNAEGSIFRYVHGSGWSPVFGELRMVSVGSAARVWGVNSQDQIYRYVSGSNWEHVPGALRNVSVGADGTVWGIAPDDRIYRRNAGNWELMPGSARQVAVGSAAHIWVVTHDDRLYRWNAGNWELMPGSMHEITVAADGTVCGVNPQHYGWRWNGSTWQCFAGYLLQAGVGSANLAWAVRPDHTIVRTTFQPLVGTVLDAGSTTRDDRARLVLSRTLMTTRPARPLDEPEPPPQYNAADLDISGLQQDAAAAAAAASAGPSAEAAATTEAAETRSLGEGAVAPVLSREAAAEADRRARRLRTHEKAAREAKASDDAMRDGALRLHGGAHLELPATRAVLVDGEVRAAATIPLGAQFTIEAWICPEATVLGNQRAIVSKWIDSSAEELLFLLDPAGRLAVVWRAEGWTRSLVADGDEPGPDVWTHVAVVRDGDRLSLHIDGRSVATAADLGAAPLPTGAAPWRIGATAAGARGFVGLVDSVRIWDHARSPATLRARRFQPVRGDEPGLVAGWNLDEPHGDIAFDAGPHELHARLVGDVHRTRDGGPEGPPLADRHLTLEGDNVVEIPQCDLLGASTRMTLEAWIFVDAITGASAAILGQWDAPSTPRYQLAITADGRLALDLTGRVHSDQPAPFGRWCHVAVVRDGELIRFYRDGAPIGATTAPMALPLPSPLANPRVRLGEPHAFSGALAEVRVWSIARTGDEIRDTYRRPHLGDEPGLVALWPLHEGVGGQIRDLSPLRRHGALTRPATWPPRGAPPRIPGPSHGLGLAGAQYVEFADDDLFTASIAITIEGWVRLDALVDETAIVHKWAAGADAEYKLALTPDGHLRFGWHTGTADTFDAPGWNHTTSTGVVLLARWTHVAVVRAGRRVTFYIDGAPAGFADAADLEPFRNGAAPLRIGGPGGGAGGHLRGTLANVRIWRVARSAAEIAATMAQLVGCRTPGRVLDLRFDEGSGTSAFDVASGRVGVLRGEPSPTFVRITLPARATPADAPARAPDSLQSAIDAAEGCRTRGLPAIDAIAEVTAALAQVEVATPARVVAAMAQSGYPPDQLGRACAGAWNVDAAEVARLFLHRPTHEAMQAVEAAGASSRADVVRLVHAAGHPPEALGRALVESWHLGARAAAELTRDAALPPVSAARAAWAALAVHAVPSHAALVGILRASGHTPTAIGEALAVHWGLDAASVARAVRRSGGDRAAAVAAIEGAGHATTPLLIADATLYARSGPNRDLFMSRHRADGTLDVSRRKIGDFWGGFRHLCAVRGGHVYGVHDNGDLYYFHHDTNGGFDAGSVIDHGWAGVRALAADAFGRLYVIDDKGDLVYFAHDSGLLWTTHASKIGIAWGGFTRLLAGGDGRLYGLTLGGQLIFYEYNGGWVREGQPLAGTWGDLAAIAAGANGTIYTVDRSGALRVHRHDAQLHWLPDSGRLLDRDHPPELFVATGPGAPPDPAADARALAALHAAGYD